MTQKEIFGAAEWIGSDKYEKENMEKLYQLGYEDGKKIEKFVNEYRKKKKK